VRDTYVTTTAEGRPTRDKGSALVLSMVVLALLTAMGIALVSLANSDVRMNQIDVRGKRAFYVAEAGLEDAREALRAANVVSTNPYTLDDELQAAASDPNLDLNVASLAPTYDSGGNVTAFTGYGNDVPLRSLTSFGRGWYAAFLTNDAADGVTSTNDTNDRVMITSIGTAPSRGIEVVQAVVERDPFPMLPSTITLLGEDPNFFGGNSGAKEYIGDDCDGTPYTGVPGLSVPVLGAIGSASEAAAEAGAIKPLDYQSDGQTGNDTVADVQSTISPLLMDCGYLLELADMVRASADYICYDAASCSHLDTTATLNTVTFVDGDLTLGPGIHRGFIWVTGDLVVQGNTSFEGVLFVVGKGTFLRDGGGNGETWGGTLVADVAGPDNLFGTPDDCTGPNAGFDQVSYQANGAGNHETVFCTEVINETMNGFPLRIVDFRQR